MIGRDLDFDLHNAIQDLIAEGCCWRRTPIRIAWLELSSTMGTTGLLLHNGRSTTLS